MGVKKKAKQESVSDTGAVVEEPAVGPDAVTVQFRWGVETFKRTDVVQSGRYVYKSRTTLDGRGGLTLGYKEDDSGIPAHWALGSGSGGTLYRLENDGATPAA